MDQAIAIRQQETVLEIASRGLNPATALETALSALIRTDHLVALFESEKGLPSPIACLPGCHFCCYNQIEVTPPEALLLGDYLEKNFSAEDRRILRRDLDRLAALKAGKSKKEIANIRQELPCPFLAAGRCRVYPVRPLVCRAMHALDAGECQAAFRSGGLAAVAHYAHRRVFAMSVVKGLLDGCRKLGCQSGYLDLAAALQEVLALPDPISQWLQGGKVFSRLSASPGSGARNKTEWRSEK